jgi:hypothetical protein
MAVQDLQKRIDTLERRIAIHDEALDAIDSVSFREFEVEPLVPLPRKFVTQGNLITPDFRRKSD